MLMKKKDLIIIIFGVVVLVFLNLNLKGIRNFFHIISTPVQKVLWRQGSALSNSIETIFRIKGLKQENDNLVLRIEELLAENVGLRELKRENETLRGALDIGLQKDFNLSLVEVTSKDFNQDFILINKGQNNGLSPGMTVITSQKVLIGRISEVFDNFSKVMLISCRQSSLSAEIQDREVEGVAQGEGAFSLRFNLVNVDKEIEQGDVVITSSLDNVFAQGLLVGQVKLVEKKDVEPFQAAWIEPFFNISDLRELFVICGYI